MKITLTPGFVILLFIALASSSLAQSKESLFNGAATVVVPPGAKIERYQTPQGDDQYSIYFSPTQPSVFIVSYKLPRAEQKWSNARWRENEKSYYTNKKNKQKYKFKNFKFQGKGNTVVTEYQGTFKDQGKQVTTRSVSKEIRVNKATILAAFYVTPKPGSWNNKQSKRLRGAVASFRLK